MYAEISLSPGRRSLRVASPDQGAVDKDQVMTDKGSRVWPHSAKLNFNLVLSDL